MANIVNFTDKQFENRLNDNLEELVQGKKAVESPTAFLRRSKFIWGGPENEVKKLGVSGYPKKVYPTTKPSGKTGGF